jgi:hypothetical protein
MSYRNSITFADFESFSPRPEGTIEFVLVTSRRVDFLRFRDGDCTEDVVCYELEDRKKLTN